MAGKIVWPDGSPIRINREAGENIAQVIRQTHITTSQPVLNSNFISFDMEELVYPSEEESNEEELTVRDALGARPIMGGGAGEAAGVAGLDAVGFCQDEKKSSSSAAPPFEAGDVTSAVPSTTIRVGNLRYTFQ